MNDYNLKEITEHNSNCITYTIQNDKHGSIILRHCDNGAVNGLFYVGFDVTETKRGWNFNSFFLEGKHKMIFLPRGKFKKIEI